MKRFAHTALQRVAESQLGLFTTRQAVEAGFLPLQYVVVAHRKRACRRAHRSQARYPSRHLGFT